MLSLPSAFCLLLSDLLHPSSLIPRPSSYCSLISFKSQARCRAPTKMACSLNSFLAQTSAQTVIVNHARDSPSESFNVKRINEQTCIADYFRQTCLIACYNRRAALHGFQGRQSETFKVRWINERESARVKRGQICFRHIPCQNRESLNTLLSDSSKRLTIKPGEFSD